MSDSPFSLDRYPALFAEGLGRLLADHRLGTFILVLANALQDERLHQRLEAALVARFEALADELTRALRQGGGNEHPSDDLLVFLKLMAVGLEHLAPAQVRRAGPWELQYNPLRAFRPARMSQAAIEELKAPFDPNGFHFDKPFLQAEILWQGRLLGRPCRLFYNKFPFAPGHALLVPEPEAQRPQFLTRQAHEFAWSLLEEIGGDLPFSGLAYNARGACSSVNHLHFQFYAGKVNGYPVEAPHWRHHGGNRPWPGSVQCHQDRDAAWRAIQALHERPCPYNLLYRPGRLYVMPRPFQTGRAAAPWCGCLGWAELAGTFTLARHETFLELSAEEISTLLADQSACSNSRRQAG